jgi:hypothetical protein
MASVCVFFLASICYLIASRTLRRDFYLPEERQA